MGFQTNHGLVRSEIRHLRRRVPSGARGQLVPLHQHTICDAFLCEVIKRGTPANATADNNDLRVRFHAETQPVQNIQDFV